MKTMDFNWNTNKNIKEFFGNLKETKGYQCPNCGNSSVHSDDFPQSLIESTPMVEYYNPDPYYKWYEKHKCPKCETIYIISNGS